MKLIEAIKRILNDSETKDNCIVFVGPIDTDGYGILNIDGKSARIHRIMAHHYGILDLKDSLMALHTRDCPNKTCFKKEHLYAGTISDNRRDVLALRPDPKRKWCRQGHEFTKSNTIWNRRGDRLCKICYEANNKRNNLKKRTK